MYGWSEWRGRNHGGIDFGMPEGTPLLALEPGRITYVGYESGFGNFIEITYDSGDVHTYAHLQDGGILKKVDSRVMPGDTIALSGNTGNSTGAHLHWEVSRNGTKYDPMEYIRKFQSNPPQVRSSSGNVAVGGSTIDLGNGNYTAPTDGNSRNYTYVPPTAFSGTTPFRSPSPEVPPNKPSNNYGYAVLRDDAQLRQAVNDVANQLQMPGLWLADVIAHESANSWSSSIRNFGDGVAVGLIQFMPDTARGLGTTTEALSRMSAAEQMTYVYNHLKPFAGRFESIFDVAVAIFRPGYFDRWKRGEDFEGKTFLERNYFPQLGKYTGRNYYRQQANVVHTRYVASCSICQRSAYGGIVVPHEVGVYG